MAKAWLARLAKRLLMGDATSAEANALYQLAVAAARQPRLYQPGGGGIADSVDGRFDAVCLMVVLLVWRLRGCGTGNVELGQKLAQDLVDTMFADMEASLLRLGVGENKIGKKMRPLASAFGGRMAVYSQALDNGDGGVLATALMRNLYRLDNAIPTPAAKTLAKQICQLAQVLGDMPDARLLAGKVTWGGLASLAKKRYNKFCH